MADGKLVRITPGDELPYQFGNREQVGNFMEALGAWEKEKQGLVGKWGDEWVKYYTTRLPGRLIAGMDVYDKTPVGYVAHPAPLDITSAGYIASIGIEITEAVAELLNPQPEPNEADKKFEQWLAEHNILRRALEEGITPSTARAPSSWFRRTFGTNNATGLRFRVGGSQGKLNYVEKINESEDGQEYNREMHVRDANSFTVEALGDEGTINLDEIYYTAG